MSRGCSRGWRVGRGVGSLRGDMYVLERVLRDGAGDCCELGVSVRLIEAE